MIARVWHGSTKPEDADAYEAMLKPELLPGVGKVTEARLEKLGIRTVGDLQRFDSPAPRGEYDIDDRSERKLAKAAQMRLLLRREA